MPSASHAVTRRGRVRTVRFGARAFALTLLARLASTPALTDTLTAIVGDYEQLARETAEQALGAGFDIRAFHDRLLTDGPMPLSILEQRVDSWIAGQQPCALT
jgi:hypothetical protein